MPTDAAGDELPKWFKQFCGRDDKLHHDAALRDALNGFRKRLEPLGYRVDEDAFFAHCGGLFRKRDNMVRELQKAHASDLVLAFAAHTGDDEALKTIARKVARETDIVMRKAHWEGVHRDDIMQQTLERILSEGKDTPKPLAQYAGRAPLGIWLQIIALRIARRSQTRLQREPPTDDLLLEQFTTGHDAKFALLKPRYRSVFKESFQTAFAALSFHDRLLLRQQVIDKLSIDEIGRLHKIHRATAARWLAKIHYKLQQRTCDRMRDILQVEDTDIEEIIKLISSQLSVSLERLLTT